MTTNQRILSQAAAPNSGDDDDIGAFIYKESWLRKKEAAAAAARSEKNSSASTHRSHLFKTVGDKWKKQEEAIPFVSRGRWIVGII